MQQTVSMIDEMLSRNDRNTSPIIPEIPQPAFAHAPVGAQTVLQGDKNLESQQETETALLNLQQVKKKKKGLDLHGSYSQLRCNGSRDPRRRDTNSQCDSLQFGGHWGCPSWKHRSAQDASHPWSRFHPRRNSRYTSAPLGRYLASLTTSRNIIANSKGLKHAVDGDSIEAVQYLLDSNADVTALTGAYQTEKYLVILPCYPCLLLDRLTLAPPLWVST